MPVNLVTADHVTRVNGKARIASTNVGDTKTGEKYHGKRTNIFVGPTGWVCRAKQRIPRMHLITPGGALAVDCEGVYLPNETGVNTCGLGRLSIVNEHGQVIYDTFVHYPDDVEHRPHPQRLHLGVKYADIEPQNGAQPIAEVLKAAEMIFDKSRGVVVGHAIGNDMRMMRGVPWGKYQIRDTQRLPEYGSYGSGNQVGLATLARDVLRRSIQAHSHSSVEDAKATMELYLLRKDDFERLQGNEDAATPVTPMTVVASTATITARPSEQSISTAASIIESSSDSQAVVSQTCTVLVVDSRNLTPATSSPASYANPRFAPGYKVALPYIKEHHPKGMRWDKRTSTFCSGTGWRQ